MPYSICVMVELHQIEENHFVQVFLRNDSNHDRYPLALPGQWDENKSCQMAVSKTQIDDVSNSYKVFSNYKTFVKYFRVRFFLPVG